jgi:hypothetical protein
MSTFNILLNNTQAMALEFHPFNEFKVLPKLKYKNEMNG